VQPNVAASVVAAGSSSPTSKSETEEKEKKKAPTEETAEETPPGEVKNVSISVIADLARVKAVIREKDGLKEADEVTQARLTQEYDFWKQTLLTGLPKEDASTNIAQVDFKAAPIAKIEFASAAPVSIQVKSGLSGIVSGLLENWHRIALAVFALFALFMIRGLARKTEVGVEVSHAQKAQAQEEEEIELPEVEVDMDQKRAAKMRQSIEDMIRSDPQAAVSLIRRWMARES
jgi:flagellar biosynthesis/type III secretory pathway M-ring protein FliF/YscJ